MDWKESLNNMRIEKKFDQNKWVNEKCRKFNSYLKENDINGAILSVSGGKDSAVTLALLKYTMEMENSNLKQICAISQPINSSDWAFNRAKELCNKFKNDLMKDSFENDIYFNVKRLQRLKIK